MYYFGDPSKVNAIISVDQYHKAMPTMPLEELHASSVQHPTHSDYRWLSHSRRVPLVEQSASSRAAETKETSTGHDAASDTKYTCAGVGDSNQTAFICKICRDCLCTDKPEMPWCALAILMWGGREHPLYQNLSDVMKMLFSRG